MSLNFASSPNMTMSVIFSFAAFCLHCVCLFLGASFLSRGMEMLFLYLLSSCVCEVAMAGLIEAAAGVRAWRQARFTAILFPKLVCTSGVSNSLQALW